jgi:hypothetical protein
MLAEKNFQAMHTETSQYFYVEHDIGAADFIINDQHDVRSKTRNLAEKNFQAHTETSLYFYLEHDT